jgi:hypothetical protein
MCDLLNALRKFFELFLDAITILSDQKYIADNFYWSYMNDRDGKLGCGACLDIIFVKISNNSDEVCEEIWDVALPLTSVIMFIKLYYITPEN